MQNPPRLTDPVALARNRARARADGGQAFFLRDIAITDLHDRLREVNRTFTAPAVISPFPELWAEILPEAHFIPEAEVLDLAPAAHDLVIHDLCLHWADDPIGQLVQARHALRPDGLFLGTLFGGQTLYELRAALAEAESHVTGGLSPRVAPMAEIRDLGALLQRAGFALPVADANDYTVSYESPLQLMHELRAMGEGNALHARLRQPSRRDIFLAAMDIYEDAFGEDGRIPATFEIVTLTGWAPDPSQPQPLRPGTARTRLADALRVPEMPLDRDQPET